MPFDRALEKARRYCSYQERCRLDLENRFRAWGLKKKDWEKVIDLLLEEDYLNQKRYIEAFVSGKFRIKKWGRNKIFAALLQKNIRGNQVKQALKDVIDEEVYLSTLREVLSKKLELHAFTRDKVKQRDKLYRYMLNKGYESDLILKELISYKL